MFDFSIEFAMEAFIIVLLGVAISMFVAFHIILLAFYSVVFMKGPSRRTAPDGGACCPPG